MSKRLTTILILVWLLSAVFVSAQTATSTPDMQSIINQLQQQIKSLQSQIVELQSQLETVKTELKFTKALQRGASGEEVRNLQKFLKQFPDIYPEGLVTGYFGALTEVALKRWQEQQGFEAAGVVGPKTRTKLNELLTEGAGASGVIPPGLLTAPGLQRESASIPASLRPTSTPPTPAPIPTLPSAAATSTATATTTAPSASSPATAAAATATTTTTTTTASSGTTATTVTTTTTPTSTTATTTATPGYPVISGAQAADITSSGAKLTWTTDILSGSQASYGTVLKYTAYDPNKLLLDYWVGDSNRCDGGGWNVTSHCINLTGLAAGTRYYYSVMSLAQPSGLGTESAPLQFTTALASTTTPPAAPAGLAIAKGTTLHLNPPSVNYSLQFSYTLVSDTALFNIYLKRPGSAAFTKYSYNAQLPLLDPSLWNESTASLFLRRTGPTSWYWWSADEFPPTADPSRFGEYQMYVTAVNAAGAESAPSETKSTRIYAPPVITSPAAGSTVSLKPAISFTPGDPSVSGQNYAAYVYKQENSVVWSNGYAATDFTYPAADLNPNDNPHRLVVHSYASAPNFPNWYSPFSQVTFNVSAPPAATTTATTSPAASIPTGLASILEAIARMLAELQKLLPRIR